MPSRFDDCYDTKARQRVDNLMPQDGFCPTSVGEQYRNGGFLRTDTPAGSPDLPPPHNYNGGNAGMDTDNDADDIGPPIAAVHPPWMSSA